MSKSSRLEELKYLLKSHPEGLRRSEIARRLGVHRSTAGRYIDELSMQTQLWEDGYRVGIKTAGEKGAVSLELPEAYTLNLALRNIRTVFLHKSRFLRSTAEKMASISGEKIPWFSESICMLQEKNDDKPVYMESSLYEENYRRITEAIASREQLDILARNRKYRLRILPLELEVNLRERNRPSMDLQFKCLNGRKNCSIHFYDIEKTDQTYTERELTTCPLKGHDSRGFVLGEPLISYGDQNQLYSREVHHRIKNQLYSIISYINLYKKDSDPESSYILEQIQSKISAVALIHDMLSPGKNGNSVSLCKYLEELLDQTGLTLSRKLSTRLICSGELFISEQKALYVGYVVSELLMNTVKHAFKNTHEKRVELSVDVKNSLVELEYSDNGNIRLTEEQLSKGTGLNLINLFIQNLNGTISYRYNNGSRITIRFFKE